MSSNRLLLALALLAAPFPALAQGAPDNAIEERSRTTIRLPSEEERAEALLSGDTDIVLTRRTRLFTAHGDVDLVATDNAFLTETGRVSDLYVQARGGIGAGLRIAGKYDVFADASVIGVRYFEEEALDYAALSGVVGARAPLGPLFLTATYQPTIVFERDFTRRQLTSHRLRLAASAPLRLGRAVIEPAVHGERTLADPADYEAWEGGAGISASVPISTRSPLIGFVSVQYRRRAFDSYFPGLLGTDRKDDNLAGSAGLAYRLGAAGEVRVGADLQRNWSTSDVNRYRAFSAQLGLSARVRF